MGTYDHETSNLKYQTAIEMQEMSLFALLKPSLKQDGSQWCVLYGDSIEEGIAGFGISPNVAIQNWNKKWHEQLPQDSIQEMPGFADVNEYLRNLSAIPGATKNNQ